MIGSDSSCSASDSANQKLGYCIMRARDKKNRPTLKDITREARLSASTVSLFGFIKPKNTIYLSIGSEKCKMKKF